MAANGLFTLDAAIGGVDGHGVVVKEVDLETARAIGGALRDEAVAVVFFLTPPPAYDEALISKIKKSTTGHGEIRGVTLSQVLDIGNGNGARIFINLQSECTRMRRLVGIAVVEHGDITVICLLVVTDIMLT